MAPRLVLLNGIPASGKSTLAWQWCGRHALELPLCLDIDSIRSMIGGWQETPLDAGLAARDIAVAAIRTHLGRGRDVLVPQYLRIATFIDKLDAVAQESGAAFVETALVVEPAEAQRRFLDRVASAGGSGKWGNLGVDMGTAAAEFAALLAERPHVVRIQSEPGAIDALENAIA